MLVNFFQLIHHQFFKKVINMRNSTDIVWDAIIASAKTKFDYSSLENQFNVIDPEIADNFLFKLIIGFAAKDSEVKISYELLNPLLAIGISLPIAEVESFVKGKDKILAKEIFASQIAHSLLEEGEDPQNLLKSILQMLN